MAINRRDFLKFSALAAGAAAAGCASQFRTEPIPAAKSSIKPVAWATQPAKQKVRVAYIGVGGQGGADLEANFKAGGMVVALCDVDAKRLDAAGKRHAGARTYADYRVMLEKEAKNIDAVCVGTPDHHHFPASMLAVTLGKHVYCEKPLTHSIWEARQLLLASRKAGVATQIGTQGHASEGHRLVAEWVQAGVIGNVKEVYIWTDRPRGWWPQGVDRPEGSDPIPPELDWNLWLGPAPLRPYKNKWEDGPHKGKSVYCHFVWRGWWDYGTGALGDIGCHAMDVPFWALNLTAPTTVEASCYAGNYETGPLWSDITYQYPANGTRGPVKMVWLDGRNNTTPKDAPEYAAIAKIRALAEMPADQTLPEGGQLFIGDKGKMLYTGGAPRLVPESQMKGFKPPPKTIPRAIRFEDREKNVDHVRHHAEWLAACANGTRTMDNWDYAVPLTESVLLGNLAVRLGTKVFWDSVNLKAIGLPQADSMIRRQPRQGWDVA